MIPLVYCSKCSAELHVEDLVSTPGFYYESNIYGQDTMGYQCPLCGKNQVICLNRA